MQVFLEQLETPEIRSLYDGLEDTWSRRAAERFVSAVRLMERDGWWWQAPGLTDKAIRRGILREMVTKRLSGLFAR